MKLGDTLAAWMQHCRYNSTVFLYDANLKKIVWKCPLRRQVGCILLLSTQATYLPNVQTVDMDIRYRFLRACFRTTGEKAIYLHVYPFNSFIKRYTIYCKHVKHQICIQNVFKLKEA